MQQGITDALCECLKLQLLIVHFSAHITTDAFSIPL